MQITPVETAEHEEVYRVEDREAGLVGFIAVHSTALGPAAGGLRMRVYRSEDEALDDVLRLSRGMTFKNAAADLPLGGGKAVILGDPGHDKTPELLRAMGRAVETLSGRYWTAEDMGMTTADMAVLAETTAYVAGLAGGAFASGDPSPVTARGVFNAVRRAARHRLGREDLDGLTVAVQGLGNVGRHLCALLHGEGARLIVTDIDPARVAGAIAEWSAEAVAESEIYSAGADIFAPCAIGGILNEATIPELRVSAVAGGANNQLATPEDGARLAARGILYAPDFVANGGGIINVAAEILKIADRPSWVAAKLDALDRTMEAILSAAAAEGVGPNAVAERIVAERMRRAAA
ncbi:Glu/Leu/Phe/Val dehydrogenase dimerization domain-containing protein [Defluviimonas sp. D31]|uniref:Glu/Leu/Phe/Val family dehydrogenase n=1 Tax=Defluviimonas sp. D31 TaxID=3083253 RepID=UPI00296E5921|nr:Glu/Leu/Phe/Val dehydrogenase dimerization domain-containing protein [Defluviimonas sp. D31]MDW4551080.1 Glu/Leu/Phe/Val dehydrogenase dimerization domain-containing protein [Defluviimonas sp. D31]